MELKSTYSHMVRIILKLAKESYTRISSKLSNIKSIESIFHFALTYAQ